MVDRETLSDPCEQTVNGGNEGQDGQQVGENETGDDETEDGTLGEGMEGIGGGIRAMFTPINDDAATGDRFLGLGVAHLGNGDRSGDTHDGGGNQVLGGNTKTDVCEQDGTGDG